MGKKINSRSDLQIVTHNNFFVAKALTKLSLKARKLLYIAIAQCRLYDNEFYGYEISIQEFALLMGIDDSNVYQEADTLTDELLSLSVRCQPVEETGFRKYTVFSYCEYDSVNGKIFFKINSEMTDFLLHLTNNFSKPLLDDFVRMNSRYSMEIWHLMQREMRSKKPKYLETITFNLTLKELREITGTEEKFRQVGQFKSKILDKAIREIRENCLVDITYENIKNGRTIIGFTFHARNLYINNKDQIRRETMDKIENFKKRQKAE